MNFDRKYLIVALCYAVAGILMGIVMGESHNHSQYVTHAHILLVGFVVSFFYAMIHKLWLVQPARGIATVQFYLHQAAALTMFCGLFLLYGNQFPESVLGPILGAASTGVLVGVLLMLYMVIMFGTGKTASAP